MSLLASPVPAPLHLPIAHIPPFVAIRTPDTAAHAGRAQDIRPSVRGNRAHGQAAQGAPAVTTAHARDNMLNNDGTT
jgi:hypothetical protein